MTLPTPLRSLALVAQHLPFHLHETDKVNSAFRRWRHDADDTAKYHVELWTYCFVRRYFLTRFTQDGLYHNPADMDALIEQAYGKVQKHQHTVSDSMRYTGWVSVVCRNAFLNYLRSVQQAVSIDHEGGPILQGDSLEALFDAGLLHDGLHEALGRLPDYLRDIARYRFIEGLSYQEIGARLDKPLPTVRSYVNKAVRKLREDLHLMAHLGRSTL